jgi:hypothetical protein
MKAKLEKLILAKSKRAASIEAALLLFIQLFGHVVLKFLQER